MSAIINEEIWKDIPGFEGWYQASNKGRIKSVNRKVNYKNKGPIRTSLAHILNPKLSNKGYLEVVLAVNGKLYYKRVHQLVALTFIDNPNNYPYINHINEIKTDNRVCNLEWCSPKQNNDAYYGKKLIGQYDLNDNLIAVHTIYENAGKSVGGNKHGVYRCCKGYLKTYKGFVWKLLKN